MGKLFGTDGIRGVVGKTLTAELAFHVGQAVAVVLQEELGRRPLITIGKDTRVSSDMLEAALTAEGPVPETRPCPICGRPFLPDGRTRYCSAACSATALRKQKRDYMRKTRR